MKKTKKGFTLVELMVVIAIIAILATVSVVGYTAFIKKADQSNALSELKQVATYIDSEISTGKGEVVVTDTGVTYVFKKDGVYTRTTSGKGESAATTDAKVTTVTTISLKNLDDFKDLKGTFNVSTDGKTVTYTLNEASATWTVGTFEVK